MRVVSLFFRFSTTNEKQLRQAIAVRPTVEKGLDQSSASANKLKINHLRKRTAREPGIAVAIKSPRSPGKREHRLKPMT